MRKTLVTFGAAFAMLLGMFVTATPANAAEYYCNERLDQTTHTFQDKYDTFVKATVMYKYCVPYDTDKLAYAEPYRVIGTYNRDGASMTCDPALRYLDGVRFNWYFWRPFTGANFNPGARTAECDPSTMNTVTQSWDLADVPRLYFGPGYGDDRQPRWKVNVTLLRNFNTDLDWSHAQDFNP